MNKVKIFSIVVLATFALYSSCGRKLAPSEVEGKKVNGYDVAAFDYVYVEAVKQKLFGNNGDALKYLEQCIRINPRSDAAYYQMAQIVSLNGDIRNAKKYAAKAMSLDEKNLWYLIMLSGLYYQEKNIDSAIICYEKAVKVFPFNESLQLTLGNLYIENKSFEKANNIFDSFDKKYGVNDASTLSSIKSLISTGKFDEAEVKIQSLLKENPDEVLYNGVLAEILRGKGQKEKALDVYTTLIDRNPDNPRVQLSLADFLIEEKNYEDLFSLINRIVLNVNVRREDKIELFGRMLNLPDLIPDKEGKLIISLMVFEAGYKEDDIIPLLRPDLLVKQGKLSESAQRLEELIKSKPENYYAWEKLLLVYLQAGDFEKLLARAAECSTRFNMSYLAKVLYAHGAMETGKFDLALEELKKAEILAGSNTELKLQILTMRADIYYRMKDYSKAFSTFEEALKSNKEDLTLMNNYAYYLAEQNMKLKEAEELAKKVIQTEIGNTTFLDTYAWVLYKRGKLNEAAKVMESIIKIGKTPDAEWYEHYGFILKKQRKCSKAVENWKIALELDKTKANLVNEIKNCEK